MKDGRQLAREFADFVNNFSCNQSDFVETLLTEHRTLQQSAFDVMLNCIRTWSDMYEQGDYDLRNEDTCRICNQIVNQLGDELHTRFI
jgi:hypothetical protein